MADTRAVQSRRHRSHAPLAGLIALALTSTRCASPAAPLDGGLDAIVTDAADSSAADVGAEASATPFCDAPAGVAYPPGPYGFRPGETLADLTFQGPSAGPLALRSLFTPCEARPPLLVLRVMAAWSGPSQWHASHTVRLREFVPAGRLRVVDLLALGQENLPAVARDLAPWRARYDAAPDELALDPEYRFRAALFGTGQSPIVVTVDPRTMVVLSATTAPSQDQLRFDVARFEAQLAGRDAPAPVAPTLVDDRFTADQWEQIRAMSPVPAPPPSPTNRYADDPAAAALGRALFSDGRLSPAGEHSCASCHDAARAFADGLATARGAGAADRNTPSVLFAPYAGSLFWDGRADTLWSQALGPFENPAEMRSSRLFVAHRIATNYAADYERTFGPLPPLDDAARFPAEGAPGHPAWEGMRPDDRAAVDRVFANVGKALEAFERTLRTAPTRFDAYVAGDRGALSAVERDGLQKFVTFECLQCHHGPSLSDQSFHNILFPTGRADGAPDRGRVDAVALLLANPFRGDGAFSDAPAAAADALAGLRSDPSMLGAFRTPPLRGVATTGPWGHGGTFRTLREVVVHYSQRSSTDPVPGAAGVADVHLTGFHSGAGSIDQLTAFLEALDDRARAP